MLKNLFFFVGNAELSPGYHLEKPSLNFFISNQNLLKKEKFVKIILFSFINLK